MKKWITCVIAAFMALTVSFSATAQDFPPTDTFTHWTLSNGTKYPVETKPLYEVTEVVTARSLGFDESIGTIQFIDCDSAGNTYVLTDAGRIICFDTDYKLKRDYKITGKDGAEVDFNGAKGIYVYSENEIYIADTEHSRVLYCIDGVVNKEILLPESLLIPEDFVYKPIRIARDPDGFLYVLSDGSYYGAILYTPEGEFSGFFGANTVKGNILSSLAYLWDRLTMNDIKRAQVSKKLPFQFSDICIDDDGFVYISTGLNSGGAVAQIRVLSPGGNDILPNSASTNFGETDNVVRLGRNIGQNFIGIQSNGDGLIYALDSAFGLIYIYDTESHMIAAFGGGIGQGKQEGTFSAACSIALSGSRVLVADNIKGNITVFETTEFGETVFTAQKLTLNSNYTEAEGLWQEVLKQDPVNRLALYGLSKSAYQDGNYEDAMKYAKECGDSSTYSQARTKIQNKFITDNFIWLFFLVLIVVSGIVALLIISVKKQVVFIKNAKLRTLTSAMVHPFRSFSDIKYKQMGSIKIAVTLTVLFYFTGAAAVIWGDFRYSSYDTGTYNTLFQFVQTVGLVLAWSVANWSISTLQDGKGKFKEVFIVTSYSIFPIILYNIIFIPLTHMVASAGSSIVSGLQMLAYIFCGIMITVGLMTIHDFSFPRFVFTSIITVLMIILIIFVVFMMGVLLTQFEGFFVEVILEALRRW